MTVELIDGRAGKPHISGDDLGNFKAGFVGIEGYVLETENKLAATLESANKLTINTGAAIMPTSGRHVRITSPETVTIQSGTQGQKRNDLVVLRTATSSDNTTVETANIIVIKGTPTTGTPTDPSINNGDLKLYRLSLDGISVENPVPLFNVLTPLATLGASVDQLFLIRKETIVDSMTVPGGDYEDVRKDITPPSGYIPVAYTSLTPESAHCPISQFRIKKSTNPGKYELSVVVRCVNSGSVTLSEIGADVLYVRSSLVQDLRS